MGKHETGYARVERDFYPTPAWVTSALAEHINLAGLRVWECACGDGRMAEALKRPTGRRLFTDAKPSIKARQPTLIYRIEVVETDCVDPDSGMPIEAPVIRWEGESELTADEAVSASKPAKSRGLNAKDFLLDILAGGPVLQSVVIERGTAHGFGYFQLWRAKKTLGVEDFRKQGLKSGPSYWALPQHVPPDAERSTEA